MPLDPKKIKARRKELGLTLEAAGKLAGFASYASQSWNAVESGFSPIAGRTRNPSLDTMERIAKALECKIDDLLADGED